MVGEAEVKETSTLYVVVLLKLINNTVTPPWIQRIFDVNKEHSCNLSSAKYGILVQNLTFYLWDYPCEFLARQFCDAYWQQCRRIWLEIYALLTWVLFLVQCAYARKYVAFLELVANTLVPMSRFHKRALHSHKPLIALRLHTTLGTDAVMQWLKT